jgi:20S proteasome alpha/beta subunit
MTVIAWDGMTLAADKRSTEGSMARTTTKIARAPNGALIGATGNTSMCRELRDWWIAGAEVALWPVKGRDSSLLVIDQAGRALYYWDGPVPVAIEDDFIAIGSGSDFATAAMHCGKSAREAVEIACRYNTACGNGVDELQLGEHRK